MVGFSPTDLHKVFHIFCLHRHHHHHHHHHKPKQCAELFSGEKALLIRQLIERVHELANLGRIVMTMSNIRMK